MKIGLFFGTFNPVHIGHLILANYVQQFTDLQQVWFVVTPRSPFKQNESLADDYQRLQMVQMAIEEYPYLRASNIEFKLPQPNYTTITLANLQEEFPNYEFALIMGEDNLSGLHKWKNSEFLIKEYDIYIYPRLHLDVKKPRVSMERIHKLSAPVIEISSTFIRNAFAEGKNIKPMLPAKVFEYIDGSSLYKK
ncbi:MAG: nicotinate (nicotinamide) nucleotide adenylyltransferase [Flavobacteriaceae bacterium]|nr:nicotinate (nicotinamide) nucleotide adenylyltransferase [Flavobacteriaceae bacterium]